MKEHLVTFFKGVAVGLANIIPGVSGGTMALILGIYDRLLRDISQINGPALLKLLGLFKPKKEQRQEAFNELKRLDVPFLLLLLIGAGAAILSLAKVMTLLLTSFHDPTYGFFFGLVLASAIVPWKLVKKTTIIVIIMAILGIGAGAGSDFLLAKEEKIASSEKKILIKELKAAKSAAISAGDNTKVEEINAKLTAVGGSKGSFSYYAIYFGAGALAISAMVLPGISGSFLLLAMGLYFDILAAISNYNIPVIFCFGLGCLLGLIAFSRFLNWLLKRYSDQTMGFLTGLMVGSLWTIWPFKEVYLAGKGSPFSETLYLNNIGPQSFGTNELATCITMLLGLAIVIAFIIYENKHSAKSAGVKDVQ